MDRQRVYHQLLNTIEAELTGAGCHVTKAKRRRMARLIDQLDQVKTCDDSEALLVELGRELHDAQWHSLSDGISDAEAAENWIRPPEDWLDQSECA